VFAGFSRNDARSPLGITLGHSISRMSIRLGRLSLPP
jgi:hypothetical protein